jgi:hypothetical protein
MKWLNDSSVLNPAVAAMILRDLRRVAEVDGEVHRRELALIDAFATAIPTDASPEQALLDSKELRDTYVRSLVLLALADGDFADEEFILITELANEQGIDTREVQRVAADVERSFYGKVSGLRQFSDSLKSMAAELGFSDDEVTLIWN